MTITLVSSENVSQSESLNVKAIIKYNYSKLTQGRRGRLWSSLDRAVRVQALARDIVLCSWERHFILTLPLSSQVNKWLLANLMLGVTLQWTSIPSRGELKYSQSLHATETKDKRRPDGPLGLYADFT